MTRKSNKPTAKELRERHARYEADQARWKAQRDEKIKMAVTACSAILKSIDENYMGKKENANLALEQLVELFREPAKVSSSLAWSAMYALMNPDAPVTHNMQNAAKHSGPFGSDEMAAYYIRQEMENRERLAKEAV